MKIIQKNEDINFFKANVNKIFIRRQWKEEFKLTNFVTQVNNEKYIVFICECQSGFDSDTINKSLRNINCHQIELESNKLYRAATSGYFKSNYKLKQ